MSESFDPYRKWLGIPPAEQPPHHYRLLGIGLFEDDADVIEEAADRQMAHVQTHKTGPHSALSQKLLNELAAAKLCLLDKAKKATYDAALRERPSPPAAPPQPKPLPVASRIIVEDEAPDEHEPLVFTPATATTAHAARRAKPAWQPAAVAGAVVAGLLALAAAVYFMNSGVRTASRQPNDEGRKAGVGSKARGQTPKVPKVAETVPGSKFQVPDSKPKATTQPGPESTKPPLDASAAASIPSPPAASTDLPPPETKPRTTIDLLKLIDLSRDVIAGEWRIDGGALVSPHAGGIARIELPYDVPHAYDVTIGVKRLAGSDTLGVYLPIDGALALVALDSGLAASGIHRIDGQANSGNETTRRGHFLGGDVVHTLHCAVRGNHVRLSCDGETVIDWQGDVKRLSIDGGWAVRRPDHICLASDGTSYEFAKLELSVSQSEAAKSAEPDQPPEPNKTASNLSDVTARQPAPDEKQQREAEKRVRQLFKAERAAAREPAGKLALAVLLREAATRTKTPPDERYAMLREAIELAADACDYAAAVQVVLDLAERFDVSPLPLKADALTRANRAGKSVEQKLWLFDAALVLLVQAAAADDFDTAGRVAKLAATMLRSAKDPERLAKLKERTRDVAEMDRQRERAQAVERPEWLKHYTEGLDNERELDTRVAARPLALPPKVDLARSWTLSLEFLRSNPAGDNGQVFFIGDGRSGCDPIAVWISGHRLHVRISNSADPAKEYLLTHELAAGDVGRWQRLRVVYEGSERSVLVELDSRRVAAGVCPFDPGIDRPMEIWIGGAGAGDQRFLGQVRMVLLAND